MGECLRRVIQAPWPEETDVEIVVVDDGSTDGSVGAVEQLQAQFPGVIELLQQPENRGKGAALREAIQRARGKFAIIQDADLEYSPADYPKLLGPLLAGDADAVFGSRFVFTAERTGQSHWHFAANRILTELCNVAAKTNLTDAETGYKAMRTSLAKSIPIRSNRFGFDPELTIKLAQRGARMFETPISYQGRRIAEGKKIRLKDAWQAVFTILQFGFFRRDIYAAADAQMLDVLSGAPRFNRWMADTIRPYLGETVLEIGAGIGNLTRQLCDGRERYIASDIDEEHMAHLRNALRGKRGVEVRHVDLAQAGAFAELEQSVDSVVCLNVLEHVERDDQGLDNIYRVLRPGGRAIVLVPEGMNVYGTLDEVLGHCRRYSEEELRRKMELAGFQVERVLAFNRPTRPGWFVNGKILKKRSFGRFQIFVFDHLVWLWRMIDRYLPWRPTSLIAVGMRPR